ncbi:MAG: DUF5706 domain-containing protein [Pseudomonadota bacterium]|nr:DUF5706 domain-containing protein [Pseudomonadota bacterium]
MDKRTAEASLGEFASFHEGYVRHYITLADTKAAVLLGLTSTFIGFLFSKPAFHDLLFSPTCSWRSWLAWASTALLVAGAGFAAWVITPRLRQTSEGLVFFGAVRAYPSHVAYAQAVRSAGGDQLTEARLRHCYDVSAVCWRKYHNLRLAICFSVAGFASSLPLLGSV